MMASTKNVVLSVVIYVGQRVFQSGANWTKKCFSHIVYHLLIIFTAPQCKKIQNNFGNVLVLFRQIIPKMF